MAPQTEQAIAVQERHMDFLYKLPAVVGAGVGVSRRDPKRVVIQVFTSRRLTRSERQKFPKTLEGIRLEIKVTGPVHTLPAQKAHSKS